MKHKSYHRVFPTEAVSVTGCSGKEGRRGNEPCKMDSAKKQGFGAGSIIRNTAVPAGQVHGKDLGEAETAYAHPVCTMMSIGS